MSRASAISPRAKGFVCLFHCFNNLGFHVFSFFKKNNYWGLSIKSAIGAENRYDYDKLLDANLSKGRAISILDHFGHLGWGQACVIDAFV